MSKEQQTLNLQQQMALDFADGNTKYTKEQWNNRHFKAHMKIHNASKRMMDYDNETKEALKTYLKGKFVENREYRQDGSIVSNKTAMSKHMLVGNTAWEFGLSKNKLKKMTTKELYKLREQKLINKC